MALDHYVSKIFGKFLQRKARDRITDSLDRSFSDYSNKTNNTQQDNIVEFFHDAYGGLHGAADMAEFTEDLLEAGLIERRRVLFGEGRSFRQRLFGTKFRLTWQGIERILAQQTAHLSGHDYSAMDLLSDNINVTHLFNPPREAGMGLANWLKTLKHYFIGNFVGPTNVQDTLEVLNEIINNPNGNTNNYRDPNEIAKLIRHSSPNSLISKAISMNAVMNTNAGYNVARIRNLSDLVENNELPAWLPIRLHNNRDGPANMIIDNLARRSVPDEASELMRIMMFYGPVAASVGGPLGVAAGLGAVGLYKLSKGFFGALTDFIGKNPRYAQAIGLTASAVAAIKIYSTFGPAAAMIPVFAYVGAGMKGLGSRLEKFGFTNNKELPQTIGYCLNWVGSMSEMLSFAGRRTMQSQLQDMREHRENYPEMYLEGNHQPLPPQIENYVRDVFGTAFGTENIDIDNNGQIYFNNQTGIGFNDIATRLYNLDHGDTTGQHIDFTHNGEPVSDVHTMMERLDALNQNHEYGDNSRFLLGNIHDFLRFDTYVDPATQIMGAMGGENAGVNRVYVDPTSRDVFVILNKGSDYNSIVDVHSRLSGEGIYTGTLDELRQLNQYETPNRLFNGFGPVNRFLYKIGVRRDPPAIYLGNLDRFNLGPANP